MKNKLYIVAVINKQVDIEGVKETLHTKVKPTLDFAMQASGYNAEVQFEFITGVEFDITYQQYGDNYAVANLFEKLDTLNIPSNSYHEIIFFYNPLNKQNVCNWTYQTMKYKGMKVCEIPTNHSFIGTDYYKNAILHEITHGLHGILWDNGIMTQDTLDTQKYSDESESLEVIHQNIARFDRYWDIILKTPVYRTVSELLISLLTKLVALLKSQFESQRKTKIQMFADAIERYENMDVSYNNPGALRWSKFQSDSRNGFSVFPSYEIGRKALEFQIEIAVNGTSNVYSPQDTILSFFEKYAPSSDNNDPLAYAQYVADYLGIDIETQIKELA